jgi:tetratricopeptide (TPR) repeat protein
MDLAKKAFGCNNFKLATDIFDHLLQAHGPNMDWLISRGDAYVRQGKMNEALADYVHAFRLGEVRPGCLNELVNALVAAVASQGQLADQLAQHRARLKGRPLDAFTCRACQQLLYEPATLPCGHTFCKDCLNHVQDSWTCLKCQAKPDKRSKYNMNIVLSRMLEKYFPEETKSRRLRAEGNKLYAQRKHREAIKKYTESHELVPSDHFVLSNRSHVYTVLEQYEEALLDAEHACQLKPDWAKGYYRKGVALAGQGRQEEALVAFLQSLTLDGLATSARKSLEKVGAHRPSPWSA